MLPIGPISHLSHLEDLGHEHGKAGLTTAFNTLRKVHRSLSTGKEHIKTSTKLDDSPSIVFGHHPETGKFFVASKSAFNKKPKINYSHADIDANHGHVPGLATKLKTAFDHLPKITPKTGVFQGGVMHTPEDVKHEDGNVKFTPNTITYGAKKGSEQGTKAAASKLGVAVHTRYHGSDLTNLTPHPLENHSEFKSHPDVHVIPHGVDYSHSHYSEADKAEFEHHHSLAVKAANSMPKGTLAHVQAHAPEISQYINHTVKTGEAPTHAGLTKHITDKALGSISALKTTAGRDKAHGALNAHLQSLHAAADKTTAYFGLHKHLQNAKNVLIKNLNKQSPFEHHIQGKAADPEGFVAHEKGYPVKLVNRAGFSAANFAHSANRK